jgi:hypothetical protein
MSNLANKSDAELRELLQASRQTLTSLVESLANRPDMQNAIRIMIGLDDTLETFAGLTDNGINQFVEDLAVELQLSHL